jgi:large subunit ribosomal protein L18
MNLKVMKAKASKRVQRKRRIRAKISGTAAMPRVSIFRSNRYLSVQAIDDAAAVTLAASSTKPLGAKANKEGAAAMAADFAGKLKAAGVNEILFDRNGYVFHGVVAAFADALRANEIKF